MQVLATHHTQRHFFRDAAGVVEPRWEHLMGFAQVIVISLGLPFGLWGIWRRFRSNAAALALGLAALVYPVDQLARLAPDGTTTGSRMDAYAYLPVGFVLGVGLVYFWSHHTALWRYRIVLAGGLSVIFIGGWVLGTAPIWDRLPGPYVVAAQERSIDRQSVTAAMWVRSHLGPGHRVLTDRVNDLLMATYGDQWIVMSTNDNKVPIWPVFFSLHVDRTVEEVLRRTRVAYVVVDRRLSTGLPHTGFYYDPLEPQMGAYTTPIDSRDLAKFNGVPMVNEVFDSGGIHIYDVRAITKK
jgi:hypothetical protein